MQGKILFSLNTFQVSDLWFSNCEGEKWKRRRYWGRKLAYLVILHDVWPVPINRWILFPSLRRLQVCLSPLPSQSSQQHSKAREAHPTTNWTLIIWHHPAKFQRVMLPKAPLKTPQWGSECRRGVWQTLCTPWCGAVSPWMVASFKPHIRTRQRSV